MIFTINLHPGKPGCTEFHPGKPGKTGQSQSPCSELHQITHTMLVEISLHQDIFRNMFQQIDNQESSEIIINRQ